MAIGIGYAQAVTADTPASYWRLGELLRTANAADSAGAITGTYNGAYNKGCSPAVMGDINGSVEFLGGYVDMGANYAFTGTSAFTAEAWGELQVMPGGASISTIVGHLINDGNGQEGWQLGVGTNGQIQFTRVLSNGFNSVVTANNTMPLGQWVHMVGTYDGANVKLYVNGSLVGTTASSSSLTATAATCRIAGDNTGSTWNGLVDEVAIYSHALTAAQVLNHYNAARFNASGPTFLAAVGGNVQAAQAGQINQTLGMHALTLHNRGSLWLGLDGTTATPGTTWSLGTQWVTQPFTVPSKLDTIDRVEVALGCVGTGADITVGLFADSGGNPTGTAITSVTVPLQFVPVGRARMVSLPLRATGIVQGNVYHLVLQTGGTSGNTLQAYAGGSGLGTIKTSSNGTTWTTQSGQLIMGIWQGDQLPMRNVRESSTAWAEMEYDAGVHMTGVYEMVQGLRTAHQIAYSGKSVPSAIV